MGIVDVMATLLLADGTSKELNPENGSDFNLKELYTLLGCQTVEVIYLNNESEEDPLIMIGDEEARLFDDCVVNEQATKIYTQSWNVNPLEYDIVGNVIVCKSSEFL